MKLPLATLTLIASALVLMTSAPVQAQEKKVDPQSLYARVGGQPAIDATVDLFYTKVLADDRVNYFFEDINLKAQIRKQKEFISAALGGPIPWEGKDMRKAHDGMHLTEEHFGAIAEHLQASLIELKVDEALVGEIMAVVGSVKDAVLNRPEKDA